MRVGGNYSILKQTVLFLRRALRRRPTTHSSGYPGQPGKSALPAFVLCSSWRWQRGQLSSRGVLLGGVPGALAMPVRVSCCLRRLIVSNLTRVVCGPDGLTGPFFPFEKICHAQGERLSQEKHRGQNTDGKHMTRSAKYMHRTHDIRRAAHTNIRSNIDNPSLYRVTT